MTDTERRAAARQFAAGWAGRGGEKQETQRFWIELLTKVLGADGPAAIEFEVPVRLDRTSFIDGYIKSTRVLIEQKGRGVDLRRAYKQSDGSVLTPYQQARRYAGSLPHDRNPRWIVVCNFQEFHIHDMNRPDGEPEVLLLRDLEREHYRLKFLVNPADERVRREERVSLQAGALVGEIYDALLGRYQDGGNPGPATLKSLNRLCVRLVFCLYAEDAGVFGGHGKFHDYLHARRGSARQALIELFRVLDTPEDARDPYLDDDLASFPYVNGGLFAGAGASGGGDVIPRLDGEVVDLILGRASEGFDWSQISPTIFGAVFESTLNPQTRRSGGMHYTSVENIHKVIDPLFLDGLRQELAAIRRIAQDRARDARLKSFQRRLAGLTFLDPACGSGNFLTETYLSLRRLENEALSLLQRGQIVLDVGSPIQVSLGQFHGIEVNDFAVTVARTALWIAESQMMAETEDVVHMSLDFLPLKSYAGIVEGNALRMDWTTMAGVRNEDSGARNGSEKLRGPDSVAEGHGFDGGGLPAGEKPAEGGDVCPAEPDEARGGLDTVEHCGGIRAEESEGIPPLPADSEGIRHGAGDPAENLREGGLSDGRADGRGVGTGHGNTKDDSGDSQSSLLTPRRYDYIMGNPPFLGKSYQTAEQKSDMEFVLSDIKNYGNLDYVTCWHKKAVDLMVGTDIRCAFVSTNSICQGIAVPPLWKYILEEKGAHIDFAHRTFRWDSEASAKAHVHCVIIGFSCSRSLSEVETNAANPQSPLISTALNERRIYNPDGTFTIARNINAYLLDAPNIIIDDRHDPISDVPKMAVGSFPTDGGHLVIQADEYDSFVKAEPGAKEYLREYIGPLELINAKKRYCLWLKNCPPNVLRKMPLVLERVQSVRKYRMESKKAQTRKRADIPHLFAEDRQPDSSYIMIPRTSSEQRQYLPMGFFSENVIAGDTIILPGATLYHFGILTSSVHMAWMRAVCGRLEISYRYSHTVVYNNFPWPGAGKEAGLGNEGRGVRNEESGVRDGNQAPNPRSSLLPPESSLPPPAARQRIEATAQAILDARALYPGSSLADLYDEATMPPELRRAHQANDRAVMAAYGFKPSMAEAELVAELMEMYVELTQAVRAAGGR